MTFDELLDSLLGPTGIPDRLRAVNSIFNPVEGVKDSMAASRTLFAPETTPMGRVEATGNMLSGMAGVAAPAVVASRAGVPAANALAETLTGVQMGAQDVGRAVVNRLNQPGDLGTLGSNGGNFFRAYHGSPHSFDRFSMDKIGTGEGAQAYGHGLYFADSEDVAKSYRDDLSRGLKIDGQYRQYGNDAGEAAAEAITRAGLPEDIADDARWYINRGYSPEQLVSDIAKRDPEAARKVAALVENTDRGGSMYEVQINADPETFLDWDKPLSEQPQAVRDMVEARAMEAFASEDPQMRNAAKDAIVALRSGNVTGEGAIKTLERLMGNKAKASAALRDQGVPGVKYLDAGSRTAGDGSRNYAVFDDALIEILRKYGIAGVGLGGAAATGNALAPDQNRHPYD